MIKYIIYGILGFIQGFTEPLPISSSGHLMLVNYVFNVDFLSDGNFLIISNFASFLAILFIFRKDIIDLLKSFFIYLRKKEKRKELNSKYKYCWLIIIGTIPVGITGLLMKDFVTKDVSPKFLGIAFLVTSLSLFIVRNIKGEKNDKDITIKDALVIGLLQAVTICPGISRSGTVLVGCLLCGLSRSTALKYTFMLYFPVSIASMGLEVFELIKIPNINELLPMYGVGFLVAGIVTLLSYNWLSKLVKDGKLWKFSIYTLLLSIFIFIYFR